jgi:hypothetical protein
MTSPPVKLMEDKTSKVHFYEDYKLGALADHAPLRTLSQHRQRAFII